MPPSGGGGFTVTRRGFLAAAVTPGLMRAPPAMLSFDVFRDGTRIGFHRIRFQTDGGLLTANVSVEIAVKFGPVTLFRYAHSVREVWRDGQFVSLVSETNDDGKQFNVNARRTEQNVSVRASPPAAAMLAPDAIPLTHWNILCMRRPLFNPQDGVLVDSRVIEGGDETVRLADGGLVAARHYSLRGKVNLDDWYDRADVWTALRSPAKDGSIIDYRRA